MKTILKVIAIFALVSLVDAAVSVFGYAGWWRITEYVIILPLLVVGGFGIIFFAVIFVLFWICAWMLSPSV